MNLVTALLFLAGWTGAAGADQIVLDFSSRSDLEQSAPFAPTAVWNQSLRKIHPSLQIIDYYGTAGAGPIKDFDIGDGSDGAFDSSTYSRFGTVVGGNHLQLDLSAHPTLQVSRFYLEPGWILEPIGTTPLTIKSQTSVKIEGEIWCHGDDGGAATAIAAGAGGQGRCGGTKGGDGGASGQPGGDGGPGPDSVSGGQGGNVVVANAVGGGGGGARNCHGDAGCNPIPRVNMPEPGSGATGAGGSAGNSIHDPEFQTSGGGSGGGGGSSGTLGEPGAGGGGGGGTVRIFAGGNFTIGGLADGLIRANGGIGGDGNAAGGPGGGGGGGSVLVFSAGTISLNNTLGGGSSADFGVGGTNVAGDFGGEGGDGRSWFESIDYQSSGGSSYSPPEEDPVVGGLFVFYSTASQSVTTRVFDLGSSFPKIEGVTLSPPSADFSKEYRGSRDNFASDDTGWTSNVNAIQNKRYLRLRILIATSNAQAPAMVGSATLTYTPGVLTDFKFQGAGCGRTESPSSKPPLGFLVAVSLIALFFTVLKIKARQNKTLS